MSHDSEHSELQARLRAAYQARAGQIGAADLRPAAEFDSVQSEPAHELLTPDPASRSGRRARWTAPLLAAAAVIAVAAAGTVTAVRLSADHDSPATQPTVSTSPSLSAPTTTAPSTSTPTTNSATHASSTPTTPPATRSAVPMPNGPELPRTSVPWSAVGSGWTLLVWSGTKSGGPSTLYLLDPTGTRYRIADLPAAVQAYPGMWSPDGTRVLLTDGNSPAEVDLTTGTIRDITLPEGDAISYTRPRGTALLESIVVNGGSVLERFGTDGRHQLTYPTNAAGVGRLNSDAALYTDDGTQLVVGADQGLALLANDGHLVRALPAPHGYEGCEPTQWASATSVLASCGAIDSQDGAINVFQIPLSGASPTQLTRGPDKQNPFGYDELWSYSSGQLGLAPNGCGPRSLVRFGANGIGARIDVPVPNGFAKSVYYVGHHGDDVVMVAHTSTCQSSQASLFAYNAASNTSSVLLTHGPAGGSVEQAFAWGTDK